MKNILHSAFSTIYRLTSPSYRKIKASGIFDPDFYLKANPDVAAQAGDPLIHYLRGGWREGRWPGPLFDIGYYLGQNSQIEENRYRTAAALYHRGLATGEKAEPLF